ncbi:MAG: SUMF1/EgtB/PvdO family nonheme iron enzyme [Treponema sp.]|nr:SUMF1/EgtB/PvdO family nonheme iron enzyme [Treponema sp.]
MKKLLSLVLIALVSVSAMFAQTYEELLAKAKSYEAKKEWVYAMGYYYDAANVENAQEEAQQKFDALSAEIANGNPGFGKFNVFSLHDEWVKLVKNYFKYFTEFCPYDILYDGNLVQDSVDYSTRKAKYKMKYEYIPSNKFTAIRNAIKSGLLKSQTDDWKDVGWNAYSKYIFYNFPQLMNIKNKYRNMKATSENLKNYYAELKNEIKRIYAEDKIAVVMVQDGWWKPAFMCNYAYYDTLNNYDDESDGGLSFYDVKFGLYGKNGKLLSSGTRQNFERESHRNGNILDDRSYFFENITPDIMNLIDDGEVAVKPLGCYLNYGLLEEKNWSGANHRAILKPLFDIAIGMDMVKFITIEKTNNIEMIKIPGKNFEMQRTEVTQWLYESVMGKNPSKVEAAYLPVTNLSWYDAIVFCNKLSAIKGYKPVYSVNGSTDTSALNKAESKSEIVQDKNANGFRLPTNEEWEYAAFGGQSYKYAGSDNLYEVGWYCDNSDDKVHFVTTKKPNGYGLYDMSGNVAEWVWDSDPNNPAFRCCLRGGSYDSYADSCEVSFRSYDYAADHRDRVGFRLLRISEEALAEARRIEEENQKKLEETMSKVSTLLDNYLVTQKEMSARFGFSVSSDKTISGVQKNGAGYKAGIRENSKILSGVNFTNDVKSLFFEGAKKNNLFNSMENIAQESVAAILKQVLKNEAGMETAWICIDGNECYFLCLEEGKTISFRIETPENAGTAIGSFFGSFIGASVDKTKDITLTVPTAEEALAAQNATLGEDDKSEESDEKQPTKKKNSKKAKKNF